MKGPTLLHRVAGFAAEVREGGVPEEVRQDVKRRIMDTLGNALAAGKMEPAHVASEVADAWGGTPQAHALTRSGKYPAPGAALVNGTLAHALDFDDTHLPSILHPSASVVPAALAAAEAAGAGGEALIPAVAFGDELCARVGMAGYDPELGNSVFFEKGLHATSIAGTLGSAAAAAMIFGLEAAGIGHAIAIAASMGAGIIEANRTGGTVKRVHCGWAAHSGLVAAELARRGLTGPPTVFEGRFGFLRAYLDDRSDPEALVRDLGEEWELLERFFFKPYPTNHFTHAGIDAARELRETGLDPRDIAEIELRVPSPVMRTIAEPAEEKARPATPYAAQFSGPFTFVTALLGGGGLGVYLDDFTEETIRDPLRLELASKVRVVADEECDRIFPDQFPAIARVRAGDGQVHEARILHNRGGPDRPLSTEELATKFFLNAERTIPQEQIDRLLQKITDLEKLDRVESLVEEALIAY
jgi:2-methylcitrate dehydratase PrpD